LGQLMGEPIWSLTWRRPSGDFHELELKLELLGFGYNADLTKDEMEVFCTYTR
jgi:hypothetical protein